MQWYLISLTWGAGRGAILNKFINGMASKMVNKMVRQCEAAGLRHKVTEAPGGVFLKFEGDEGLLDDFKKKDNAGFRQLRKMGIKYEMVEVDE